MSYPIKTRSLSCIVYSGLQCTVGCNVQWVAMYSGLQCTVGYNVQWVAMYSGLQCTVNKLNKYEN